MRYISDVAFKTLGIEAFDIYSVRFIYIVIYRFGHIVQSHYHFVYLVDSQSILRGILHIDEIICHVWDIYIWMLSISMETADVLVIVVVVVVVSGGGWEARCCFGRVCFLLLFFIKKKCLIIIFLSQCSGLLIPSTSAALTVILYERLPLLILLISMPVMLCYSKIHIHKTHSHSTHSQ